MLGIELYRASFARCLFLLPKKKGNSCLTKNAELRLICKVADIIERLPERSWDFKYQYDDKVKVQKAHEVAMVPPRC